jgi:hypothetical protein
MTKRRQHVPQLLLILGFLVVLLVATPHSLLAKDCKEFPQAGKEPIYQLLKNILEDKDCDKLVKVKLQSGQDLEGRIKNLNETAVQLERLSGMDFYDAVVVLNQISAVIYRARTK